MQFSKLPKYLTALALILIVSCQMTSCSHVMPDSWLPTHTLIANIKASGDINPNQQGQPAPLYVLIFELSDPSAFQSAKFFDVYDSPAKTLGKSFLGVEKIYVVPGDKTGLMFDLKQGTKYIGIVAAYSNKNNATWQAVVPLQSTWGKESIWINLNRLAVSTATE